MIYKKGLTYGNILYYVIILWICIFLEINYFFSNSALEPRIFGKLGSEMNCSSFFATSNSENGSGTSSPVAPSITVSSGPPHKCYKK